MDSEVSQLVSAAVSGSEQGQNSFADKISTVLKSFSANQVRDQLVPFLVSWLPCNNRKAVLSIATHMSEICESAGGLRPVAGLIEKIAAVEDKQATEKLYDAIKRYKGDEMIEELVKALVPSKFDAVRRFAVEVVELAPKDAFIEQTCSTLAQDRAFLVRDAVGRVIKRVKPEIAAKLVPILVKDPNSRIRGFLAVDLADQPYFFDLVVGPLSADLDWSVRAALATSLGKTKEIAKAAPVCGKLIKDGVWQVILCALRSLTDILTSNKDFEFTLDAPQELIHLIKYERNPLKLAVIDCFFAQRKIDEAAVRDLLGGVVQETSIVKLHFLEEITKHKEFASVVSECVTKLVHQLSTDSVWRIRLGVVSILKDLAAVIGQPAVTEDFKELCVRMIDDETFPVRKAALQHLANAYLKEGEAIPELVERLKAENSFRKRQAAIGLLVFMKMETQSDSLKQKIDEELKGLVSDPIVNVSYVAKEVLEG